MLFGEAHIYFLDNVFFQTSGDNCGQAHFQAARVTGKSFKGLAETGTCVACCRHCVILKGNGSSICTMVALHNYLDSLY